MFYFFFLYRYLCFLLYINQCLFFSTRFWAKPDLRNMVLIYTQTFSLANKSITPPEPQLLAAAL